MNRTEALDSIELIRKVINSTGADYSKGVRSCVFFLIYLALNTVMNLAFTLYVRNGGYEHEIIRLYAGANAWIGFIFIAAGLAAYAFIRKKGDSVERAFAEIWIILPTICVIMQKMQFLIFGRNLNTIQSTGFAVYIYGYNESARQGNLMLLAFLVFTCILATAVISKDKHIKKMAALFLVLSMGTFIFKDTNVSIMAVENYQDTANTYNFNYAYMYGISLIFTAWVIYRLKTMGRQNGGEKKN